MRKKVGYVLLSLCLSFIPFCYSAKILYIFPTGCKSTAGLHHAISKILINHGHVILAISPFPLENFPNYINVAKHLNLTIYSDSFSPADAFVGSYNNLKMSFDGQYENCKNIFNSESVKNLIKNEKVDLVMLEIDGTECFLPMASLFKAPIIAVGTGSVLYTDFDGLMGNPVNPSYIPTIMSGFSYRMDFIQRLSNTRDFVVHWLFNFYYTKKANILAAKYWHSPPIEELRDKISLVFYNGHFSFIPKPVAPNSIGIAGIHIDRNLSPLPKDLKKFLDEADKGVIYFSLGSVVKFSAFPKQVHNMFVNVFKKLPYRIIWRHDKPEMLANISENILARYWLPQKDILAHRNVILFMSHNGIYSTYEAIHFAVPLLTFPVLYDQFTNAAILRTLGIGLSLSLQELDESSLLMSINEVIQNKKNRENMNQLSEKFKDRPQSPQDTLVYWIEYVLRHQNTSFLKPVGSKLPFYQYFLLDIILFLFLISCSVMWLVHACY